MGTHIEQARRQAEQIDDEIKMLKKERAKIKKEMRQYKEPTVDNPNQPNLFQA